MNLLECLIGMSLSIGVIAPVLQSGSHLLIQQTKLEQAWLAEQDAARVLEIMSRAIRMAGYREIASLADYRLAINHTKAPYSNPYLGLEHRRGWNHSDLLWVKHEPAGLLDSDCMGNTVSASQPIARTQGGLRHQRFFVQSVPGQTYGSLMCATLDQQGRLHHASLMQHIESLRFEQSHHSRNAANPGIWIHLRTSAARMPAREFSRFVAFRNHP